MLIKLGAVQRDNIVLWLPAEIMATLLVPKMQIPEPPLAEVTKFRLEAESKTVRPILGTLKRNCDRPRFDFDCAATFCDV